jgi:hypothetical protein
MDSRAVPATDRRGRVARAVVHEEHVHGESAGLVRDGGQHAADGRLLVAGEDDREAAPGGLRCRTPLRRRILRRHQRPAARRLGLRHAEEASDGGRQLEHRARLPRDRAGHGTLSPYDERHGALPPVEVAVAADTATLAVVCHQDHGSSL